MYCRQKRKACHVWRLGEISANLKHARAIFNLEDADTHWRGIQRFKRLTQGSARLSVRERRKSGVCCHARGICQSRRNFNVP